MPAFQVFPAKYVAMKIITVPPFTICIHLVQADANKSILN